jgi:hypothetical protein
MKTREYRYTASYRIGYSAVIFAICAGIMEALVPSGLLRGEHTFWIVCGTIWGLGTASVILINTQRYVIADDGVTSRNIFKRKRLRWQAIDYVAPNMNPDIEDFFDVCAHERGAAKRIRVPESIQGYKELRSLIFAMVSRTQRAASHESAAAHPK